MWCTRWTVGQKGRNLSRLVMMRLWKSVGLPWSNVPGLDLTMYHSTRSDHLTRGSVSPLLSYTDRELTRSTVPFSIQPRKLRKTISTKLCRSSSGRLLLNRSSRMGRINNVEIRMGRLILETQSTSYREIPNMSHGGRYHRNARTYTRGIGAGG